MPFGKGKRWWIISAPLVVIAAAVLLFDWNWVREPINQYISQKTHRKFASSDLHVRWGLNPTIRLRDVEFANAPWAQDSPMATIGVLEFQISLRDLFDGKVFIPRVALSDADFHFEQLADHRRNWVLSDPNDTSPSRLRISALSITKGRLQYLDHAIPMALNIEVQTFDPVTSAKSGNADAAPVNKTYTTQYNFRGSYHDAAFAGTALTGDVLSFQESGINFPLRGHLMAGSTVLDIEGTVADAARLSAIDVKLRMSGQTLANLYPFLLLPLPASPPYRIEGHLTQKGSRYGLDEIKGKIGSTDVSGGAAYIERQPRPLLQANLQSELLNLVDLGPLVGVTTKGAASAAPPTQSQTNSRSAAQSTERATNQDRVLPAGTPSGERLLPTGKFEGGRLKAIDAEAQLSAKHVKAPNKLEVQNLRVVLDLKDGLLKLDPFDVDFAGGRILSVVNLDAKQSMLSATTDVRLQRLQLAQLLPQSPRLSQSQGILDARLALKGTGNSIADIAAKADGRIGANLQHAQVSNLLDAASGLNGGKVMRLLIGGDQEIPIRCGAAAFDVKNGQGRVALFVVDTEQTRIDGTGAFDLDHERFDATVTPKPKRPGIFSLRTPLRLFGSFRHPDYQLDKTHLAMRAGGAIALGLVAPVAALIPLLETGPGSDVDCKRVESLALAHQSSSADAKPASLPAIPRPTK